MRKIMSPPLLWSYSIVIGLCSVLVGGHMNLLVAAQHYEGINWNKKTPQEIVWILWENRYFVHTISFMLAVYVVISTLFISTTIRSALAAQAHMFIEHKAQGTSVQRMRVLFYRALLKPWAIAAVIGALVGVSLSSWWVKIYFSRFGYASYGLTPAWHFSSVVSTFIAVAFAGVIAAVMNFRYISNFFYRTNRTTRTSYPLTSQVSGKPSRGRTFAAVVSGVITALFLVTAHPQNSYQVDSVIVLLGILEIITAYLFIPWLLGYMMPGVWQGIKKFSPLTGLLGERYCASRMRSYAKLAAPMMVAIVFCTIWFIAAEVSHQLSMHSLAAAPVNITAVVPAIAPENTAEQERAIAATRTYPHSAATPLRQDDRWVIKDTAQLLRIYEAIPTNLAHIMQITVTAGNLTHVTGLQVASSRPGDVIGQTLHLISPTGSTISVHIVALVTSTQLLDPGLIVSDATFPQAHTTTTRTITGFNDVFPTDNYTIFYSGITPQQLRDQQIIAQDYSQWVHDRADHTFNMRGGKFVIDSLPIFVICIALVLIASIRLMKNNTPISQSITRIRAIHRYATVQVGIEIMTIWLAMCVLSPLAAITGNFIARNYIHHTYHTQAPIIYPWCQLTVVAGIMVGTALAPLAVCLLYQYVYRKHSQRKEHN